LPISSRIFDKARQRGRGVPVTSAELHLLRTDKEQRQDLADAVVFLETVPASGPQRHE